MVKSKTFLDATENQHFLNSINNSTRNHGEANMVMDELKSAIGNLSENLKVPFMMSFNGYKYEEIADKLHIPLGTVKIRIHTARQRLKAQLKVYENLKF